jgi:hypothetical protein
MAGEGRVLLFRTRGVAFALPVARVARLGQAVDAGLLFDPVAGVTVDAAGYRPQPEGLAEVGGEGLTLGVPMDTIDGIESAAAVRTYPVPPLLSPCTWLAGLVEARERLYLLLDPGGAREDDGTRVAPEGPKAQEDAER